MSSQRQRKRNSQFKKKKFDHRHHLTKLDTQEKDDQPLEESAVSLFNNCLIDLYKKDEETSPLEEKITQQTEIKEKSYRKQMIQSNWERYDETESDIIDENLIEERLSQLLTTKLPPNQPIQDSTIHSDKETISLPSLDLILLGSSMSCIPLYKRLNIDKELMDISQRRYTNTEATNDQLNKSSNDDEMTHPLLTFHANLKFRSNWEGYPVKPENYEDKSDYELDEILHKRTTSNSTVSSTVSSTASSTVSSTASSTASSTTSSVKMKEEQEIKEIATSHRTIVPSQSELDNALDDLLDM